MEDIWIPNQDSLTVTRYVFLIASEDERYAYFRCWNDPDKVKRIYIAEGRCANQFFKTRQDAIKYMLAYAKSVVSHLKSEVKQ